MNKDYEIKKIKHLNCVLRSLRDVGRLIVTQGDKKKLISGVCNILVKQRGYYNAWIGLFNLDYNVEMVAHAGFNGGFEEMYKLLDSGDFTRCIKHTLKTQEVFSAQDPVKECKKCILSRYYAGRGSIAVRISHEKRNYGFLILSIPQELSTDDTEKDIVKEIADDIAFGLSRIDLELKREEAEKKQKESQFRFKTLIENSLNFITIIQNDEIVYRNYGLRKVHKLLEKSFEPPNFNSIYEEDQKKIRDYYKHLIKGKITHIETDFRYYRDGSNKNETDVRWALISATKIDYMGVESILTNTMDITDSKEVENFLKIQDKMTSLGRVTAGIAHEIRNPLSGIYIYLKALKKIYNNMGEIKNVLSIIDKVELASNKIESIIKRVMDFSKPGKPTYIKTNINEYINEVTKLTSVTLRKSGIKFIKKLDLTLPEFWNEPHLIEQVVLNLITNAAEAMKNFEGEKSIELKTYKVENCINIAIRDTGPGIPISSQSKIFDPFYTTKSNSSGIGLSICHRIITDHGGKLKFSSGKEKGTEFIIELPLKKGPKAP
ncbi:MAG: GHKL domain-containing protein [Desulfobacterales bacterium]|nr:GHKL domain-containing protein [Desulfobacterales bacterium]